MFDPDYRADGPLSPKDAIRAMLDGEELYDKDGYRYRFDEFRGDFIRLGSVNGDMTVISKFTGFYRRAEKRKRTMTLEEAQKWAESKDSLGWMVRFTQHQSWTFPRYFFYKAHISQYQRARLLPDLSGVDEDTIQGFEVVE
jgi:hypothetical protein